ncbi:MAG: cell division protein FtsW [Bdellovibrionaceae bacterium]|nr:cell division protein FtsW [Pseudobdellovibrionaceae bacterium]MEC9283719.1 putative peptidoglycan glycosyltransferase FtsW [Bdellovibrionota bacterium]
MWKEETTSKNSSTSSAKSSKRGRNPFSSLFRTKISEVDFDLFLVFFLFLGIGLVQVYSTSFIFATERLNDGLFFFKKQAIFSLLSILCMFGFMNLPLRYLKKFGILLWIGATLSVLAVYIPGVGVRVGGALRWIQLPMGIRFEGSEYLKIFLPVALASMLVGPWKLFGKWSFVAKVSVLALPMIVLLKHPDFGSFVLLSAVIFSVLFAFGLAWKYIGAAFLVGLSSFLALIWFVPYRKARLMAFLDPWSDPNGSSFQVIQSMLGFYSGGITGKGLGQGQLKLFFLPEAHTDFTLSVFAEEFGYIGLVLIICLYAFVMVKGFRISLRVQDFYYRVVALGLTCMFSFQVFINMGVNMGLLPTKGLTLPFLSYGGSSLVAMGILFGLLLNISRFQQGRNIE